MKLALILVFYAIGLFLLRLAHRAGLQDEGVRLLLMIGVLVLPIVVYSWVDFRMTRNAITQIGRSWCGDKAVDFIRTDLFKNHCSIIYKDRGKTLRQKFRIHFVFSTWSIKQVEWL